MHPIYIQLGLAALCLNRVTTDEIELIGYDLDQDDDAITATLFWKALKPLDISYKVFLHLVNKETGEIIAQNDAIPRDWSYPTTAWKTGEVIRDVVTLPISPASVDNYQLRVGLYDELTGQRLLVARAQGASEIPAFRSEIFPTPVETTTFSICGACIGFLYPRTPFSALNVSPSVSFIVFFIRKIYLDFFT